MSEPVLVFESTETAHSEWSPEQGPSSTHLPATLCPILPVLLARSVLQAGLYIARSPMGAQGLPVPASIAKLQLLDIDLL